MIQFIFRQVKDCPLSHRNGAKRFVFDAEAATDYLCAARTEEGKVVFLLVDAKSPGITVTPHIGFLVSVAEVRFDNVVAAPHIAGGDTQSNEDMARECAENIVDLFRGGWPAGSIVNPEIRPAWNW